MNDLAIYGLIALGAFAIAGLGIRFTLNHRGGTKNDLKNVTVNGPYAGRDNRGMGSEQDKER